MCLSSFAFACGERDYYDLPNGRFLVRAGKWDGKSPLPTAVFFHGHRGSALETMENKDLGDRCCRAESCLVAPDGLDGGWSASPLMGRGRDDVAFARDVVEDVARRFPCRPFASDRDRLFRLAASLSGASPARAGRLRPMRPYPAFLDPIPRAVPAARSRYATSTGRPTPPCRCGQPVDSQRTHQAVRRAGSIARLRAVDGCRAQPSHAAGRRIRMRDLVGARLREQAARSLSPSSRRPYDPRPLVCRNFRMGAQPEATRAMMARHACASRFSKMTTAM